MELQMHIGLTKRTYRQIFDAMIQLDVAKTALSEAKKTLEEHGRFLAEIQTQARLGHTASTWVQEDLPLT